VRIAAGAGLPLLLIVALAWPLLFTDATFNKDWLNNLWYVWHQGQAIQAGHAPSLFVNYSGGVFYPFYAFYGGTLYALTGMLSLALGDAPLEAYVLLYLLGLAAAYGGWLWIARTFGLRGWPAHVPAVVFVTSGAYLTMIYGLGDWPEFTAVSAMPLMIAAAIAVLRGPQLNFWPAAALAASSVVFFGSHLLTVIWGTTLLLLALPVVALVPEARRGFTRAGVLRVLGLAGPALLVSAWFLLPAFAYESQTVIAHAYPHFRALLRATMYTVAAPHLFTLSRARAANTVLTLALPVLAIAWTLGSIAILLATRRGGHWTKVLLLLAGATALLLVVMTHAGIILALPRMYAMLQFSFRLESYVLMGISGTLLAALVLVDEGGRRLLLWRWLLVPIAIVSIVGAVEQVDSYAHMSSRDTALASFLTPVFEQEGLLNYVDDDLPILPAPLPRIDFPPSTARGGNASELVDLRRGRRFDTNLRSGPGLIQIGGARIVGTDAQADDVLEVDTPRDPSRRSAARDLQPTATSARIAVGPPKSLPVVAGRLLSLVALAVLAAELGTIAVRRRAAKRAGTIPHRS
jgi:hypothetical protein